MTLASRNPATFRSHPLYQEGMAHMQAGHWQEAIASFESLLREFPGSAAVERLLDEARFKARVESTVQVNPQRWIFPWRTQVMRGIIIVLIALIAYQGFILVRDRVLPAMSQIQANREVAQWIEDGNTLLQSGRLDEAQTRFEAVLAREPDNEDAKQGLAQVDTQRNLLSLYDAGVAAQNAGQLDRALQIFTEIVVQAPGYADVSSRITAIKRQADISTLFAEAQNDVRAGRAADAIAKYEQIRAINVNFERDTVTAALAGLYLQAARDIITSDNPDIGQMSQAVAYLNQALALDPRNPDATEELRVAQLFVDGQTAYETGRWDDATVRLSSLYAARPGYLKGAAVEMLYEAYVRSGDQHQTINDLPFAFDQYRRASELPVADVTTARGRMAAIMPLLTPTATPTVTPTPTLVPTPTPYRPPPTATPPAPLATYHNQIIFRSDKEEQPGLWLMDANGKNRRYLGDSKALRDQYDALFAREKYSPDGRFRAFVRASTKADQIWIELPLDPAIGPRAPRQLTTLTGLSYDPAWSPDGSRIVFVSQEDGSDDIWIVNADGTDAKNLTRNTWEWDKHPSWSPDSTLIVFWSNREGTKQIYVMDPNGQNIRKLSGTTWDEYDPIWIK